MKLHDYVLSALLIAELLFVGHEYARARRLERRLYEAEVQLSEQSYAGMRRVESGEEGENLISTNPISLVDGNAIELNLKPRLLHIDERSEYQFEFEVTNKTQKTIEFQPFVIVPDNLETDTKWNVNKTLGPESSNSYFFRVRVKSGKNSKIRVGIFLPDGKSKELIGYLYKSGGME